MVKKYYEILGVQKDVTDEELKKAFRKKAHEHHPDKGGDEKKFKEINTAYQVLSDKQKRAQYDQFGSASGKFGGYSNADFYSQFSRGGFGQKFEMPSLKKVPWTTWIILLPFILLIAFLGLIFIIGLIIRLIFFGVKK